MMEAESRCGDEGAYRTRATGEKGAAEEPPRPTHSEPPCHPRQQTPTEPGKELASARGPLWWLRP